MTTKSIMKFNLARTIYLIALAHLVLELCANFLPVIYPILISTMNLTYAQIGMITLVFGTGSSLAQPLFGYLSDRYSPQWIIIISIFWIGLVMGLVGYSYNYLAVLLLVGLGSLGSAAFHPAGAALASASTDSRRGTALSIFSVGGNLGSAFSPLWVTLGIGWLGLQGTTILIPVAILVCLLLYKQFYLGRPRTKNPVPAAPTSVDQPQRTVQHSGSIARLILIIAAVMCRNWFQVSMVTYLPEWMHKQGWSLTASGQFLAVMLVSVSVGSLLGGSLSDKIGRWQVVAASLGILGPAQWLFMSSEGLAQAGLVALMGVLIGASFPVAIVMAQEVWPQGVGMASALVLGLGWLPGGIGASVTGFIADQFSLAWGLQSLVIPPLLGLIFALIYATLSRRSPPYQPQPTR